MRGKGQERWLVFVARRGQHTRRQIFRAGSLVTVTCTRKLGRRSLSATATSTPSPSSAVPRNVAPRPSALLRTDTNPLSGYPGFLITPRRCHPVRASHPLPHHPPALCHISLQERQGHTRGSRYPPTTTDGLPQTYARHCRKDPQGQGARVRPERPRIGSAQQAGAEVGQEGIPGICCDWIQASCGTLGCRLFGKC